MARTRRAARPPLGQHFLIDPEVRDAILQSVPADGLPILEIGAGEGVLTELLRQLDRPLVAVELDTRLADRLRRRLPADDAFMVLNADILDLPAREALASVGSAPPYGVVGNLPFAITAPLFRKLLSREADPPAWVVVMVQREVAEHVVAAAGKRSLLSISVQYYAEAEWLFGVEPESFRPPPRVRSAVVRLRRLPHPAVETPSDARFFEVVRAGFRAPRKQLHNAMAMGLWMNADAARSWLAACGIDSARRAATLTLEEWARLAWERERFGAPPPAETQSAETPSEETRARAG